MRLLLSGLLLLVIAGCGDDSIPLNEYVERADNICRDVVEPTKNAKSMREIVDISRSAMTRIDELPRPDERQDDAEAFETSMRKLIDSMEGPAEQNRAQGDKTVKAAKDLGLQVCAQGTG